MPLSPLRHPGRFTASCKSALRLETDKVGEGGGGFIVDV